MNKIKTTVNDVVNRVEEKYMKAGRDDVSSDAKINAIVSAMLSTRHTRLDFESHALKEIGELDIHPLSPYHYLHRQSTDKITRDVIEYLSDSVIKYNTLLITVNDILLLNGSKDIVIIDSSMDPKRLTPWDYDFVKDNTSNGIFGFVTEALAKVINAHYEDLGIRVITNQDRGDSGRNYIECYYIPFKTQTLSIFGSPNHGGRICRGMYHHASLIDVIQYVIDTHKYLLENSDEYDLDFDVEEAYNTLCAEYVKLLTGEIDVRELYLKPAEDVIETESADYENPTDEVVDNNTKDSAEPM